MSCAERLLLAGMLVALNLAGTVSAAAPPRAGRQGLHGAIAVHAASGAAGYSYDYASARDARIAALNHCGHPNCEVVSAVRGACAAAVVSDGKIRHATGATRAEAETKAARHCNEKAECRVLVWTCTS